MIATGAPPPRLEVTGLCKVVTSPLDGRSMRIIDRLSFTVAEGEFVTILGPSGAGKTTLLNLIAQLDAPTAGQVRVGSSVAAATDRAALRPGLSCQIGYVTQEDNLLPWRNTIDNILFPLQAQRRLTADRRAYAYALLERVGLSNFSRHYPHELSEGMRKRVSLLRTLVYDPPVILMDEPFASLDVATRGLLQRDLLDLWGSGRKTIVFVTHDITEAIVLGDRVLVLMKSPARLRGEHRVTLPRPRASWATDPAWLDVYRAVDADCRS